MKNNNQFKARISFHFREHGGDRRNWFAFGADLHRRVPMKIEGVDELFTVGMFVHEPVKLMKGDEIEVGCMVIAPELLYPIIKVGVIFELWDGGYFANGIVTEKNDSAWHDKQPA